MFKAMLANSKNKKYLCRLLSLLFEISEEEAMKSFRYSKNELDRDNVRSRANIVDIVGTLGKTKVNIEMNKTNTIPRNVHYLEVLSKEDNLSGTKFGERNLTVQVNLTDICFKGDKTVNYFCKQDISDRTMGNEVLVNASIPMIRKKMYTLGEESLDEIERYVAIVTMDKKREAEKLAKGDELYMEYIKDAKKAEKSTSYYDDFDYEVHLAAYYTQDGIRKGLEDGIKQGLEQGREEEREKRIQKMLEIGMPLETIIKCFDLTEEEIKKIKIDE